MGKLARRAVLHGSSARLAAIAMPADGSSPSGSHAVLLDLEAQWLAARRASDEEHARFVATGLEGAGEASNDHAAAMFGLEQRIKETPATTVAGLVVKLRVAATIATHGWQKADDELESDLQITLAALRDAERLVASEC